MKPPLKHNFLFILSLTLLATLPVSLCSNLLLNDRLVTVDLYLVDGEVEPGEKFKVILTVKNRLNKPLRLKKIVLGFNPQDLPLSKDLLEDLTKLLRYSYSVSLEIPPSSSVNITLTPRAPILPYTGLYSVEVKLYTSEGEVKALSSLRVKPGATFMSLASLSTAIALGVAPALARLYVVRRRFLKKAKPDVRARIIKLVLKREKYVNELKKLRELHVKGVLNDRRYRALASVCEHELEKINAQIRKEISRIEKELEKIRREIDKAELLLSGRVTGYRRGRLERKLERLKLREKARQLELEELKLCLKVNP